MKKFYRIASQIICIDAPHFPKECDYWKIFEISSDDFEGIKADFNVKCKITESLPVPDAECVSANDVSVYFNNGMIFRNKFMGTAPGVLTCYHQNNNSESTSYFTNQSYNTMMDNRYMWDSIALAQLLLNKNIFLMHSSYIEINGKALLFSAPCGTGKSTQAELWQNFRNAKIINGDKSAVSVENGKTLAHGVPFCGTSNICHNKSLPLCGIVILHQSKTNCITRLSGITAIRKITENIFLDFLAPDEQRNFVYFVINLLFSVPLYSLCCTHDENAVITLENQLRKEGLI